MIATSTGGSITGKGGNFVVVDDPHNPLQVLSQVSRDTTISYFDQALSTRLDDPAHDVIVVVMQRLHELKKRIVSELNTEMPAAVA